MARLSTRSVPAPPSTRVRRATGWSPRCPVWCSAFSLPIACPCCWPTRERGVIGALHAGWRGTLAGIAGAGVRAMVRQGAEASAISALLGPSIGPCCFEVDDELARRFERRFERAHAHVHPSDHAGKAYLDLRGVIADQLALAGLRPAEIRKVGPCTKCAIRSLLFAPRGGRFGDRLAAQLHRPLCDLAIVSGEGGVGFSRFGD